MQPRVTIIIPVYNVERYLRQCLDSVVNQTMRDIQIICINDGSPDHSRTILQEYADRDSRIEIIDKPNGGQSSARNIAFPRVKGKYVLFVDSDDWIEPVTCEMTFYYAEQTRVDFVFFQRYCYVQETTALIPDYRKDTSLLFETLEQKKRLLADESYTAALKLWRTDFLFRHSLRFPEGLINEDNFFVWSAITRAERIAFLPKFLYFHRMHESSTMHSFGKNRLDILQIYALIEEDLRSTGNYPKYRDEFIAQKIRCSKRVVDIVERKFKREAKRMLVEKITSEDIDYLKNRKNRVRRSHRDFYFSLLGDRWAWWRHMLRQLLVGPFVRSTFHPVMDRLRCLRNKLREKLTKNDTQRISQLTDLACQLSRELSELKAEQDEPHSAFKKTA